MGKHKKGTVSARANNKKAASAPAVTPSSSVSKMAPSSKILKKQKLASKRQALGVRLSAQVAAAADLRKNKNTGPVGDFKMFQNVLDSLVTKRNKSKPPAASSSLSNKAKKKASTNQKKQRQQFMRDVSFHGAVRKHADFVADPVKAITTHVQNVILMQAEAESA